LYSIIGFVFRISRTVSVKLVRYILGGFVPGLKVKRFLFLSG